MRRAGWGGSTWRNSSAGAESRKLHPPPPPRLTPLHLGPQSHGLNGNLGPRRVLQPRFLYPTSPAQTTQVWVPLDPTSLPLSPLPSLCMLLPPHGLPESSPQPPTWTWSLLPLFPSSRRWVPALGLLPIERTSDPRVQREGFGISPPTGLAAAGGEVWEWGDSPVASTSARVDRVSQEPGVGSSSGPCPMAGPAQRGGRGRTVSSWGHIGAPIWVTLHRGECQ